MTTFSNSYYRTMRGMLYSSPNSNINPSVNSTFARQLSEYAVLMKYKVDLASPEIPLCIMPLASVIIGRGEASRNKVLKAPLGVLWWRGDKQASVDGVFRIFNQCSSQGRLIKVSTKSGYTYYGNKGIVLDKEFHPLFMVTKMEYIENNHRFIKYKIYLSPTVFTNTIDPMCKALARKAMSFYLDPDNTSALGQPEIVIKDMSSCFFHAIPPTDILTPEHNNNLIHNFVLNNYQLLVNQIISDSNGATP